MIKKIVIKGAKEHNLKNVSVEIPKDQFVVITGLSGSGKSSLAFDTIYAEGQRRYVESLSAYARQFLDKMKKPNVDLIEGLSPAIAIEQKNTSKNPRSTVATVDLGFFEVFFCSIAIAGLNPSIKSTLGFFILSKNCLAYADKLSTYLLWPSAYIVSNAKDDFPEPERPVITINWSLGISTETFFRLCSFAPLITIFLIIIFVALI